MSGEHYCGPEQRDNSKFTYEEMQKQLGNAESRCNSLKHQLDYMKKVCQNNSLEMFKTKNGKSLGSVTNANSSNESVPPNDETLEQGDTINKAIWPVRQNSKAISTDKSGAAVKTIHNILTGISESVNRLSVINTQIDEKTRPSSRKNHRVNGNESPVAGVELHKKDSATQTHHKNEDSREGKHKVLPEDSGSNINSAHHRKRPRPRHHRHGPVSKSKVESSCASISLNNKKSVKSTAKHSEKRLRLNTVRTGMLESSSFVPPNKKKSRRRRSYSHLPQRSKTFLERNYYTENLVELYHNAAVNQGSDSEDDQPPIIVKSISVKKLPPANTVCKMTFNSQTQAKSMMHPTGVTHANICIQNQNQMQNQNQQSEGVPPLQIQEMNGSLRNELSPIQEIDYLEPPAAPRTEYSSCTRNYELPTIASKMKQVCKSYLRSFDFRAIPFCAARSTAPSHNIGINIQQVMSIIKTRQPISGISPTLAHNIGLAAEKLNNRPLSALVSSLGSRVTYSRPLCPLMRNSINYQQLQEMAKDVPDDQANCMISEQAAMNGASGDTQQFHQETIWTVDPSSMQRSCTCYSQQGLGFQQVLNRYQSKLSTRTTNSQQIHYKINTSKYRLPKYLQKYSVPPKKKCSTVSENLGEDTPLKGKEKTLKDVLKHLHDEFEGLNTRYEDLSKKLNQGGEPTEENLKDLESMERELTHKEEEINMVMALYKEVLSLKEQVKTLKEKASHASMSTTTQHPMMMTTLSNCRSSKYRDVKDTNTAFYLTKLLRQIQNYQECLKKEGRF